MSALKQRINEHVKSAMREKAKQRLSILRLIMAAIKQREVDERVELDDTQVLAVLDKMVKQQRDSIVQFNKAGRDDLVEKETSELKVIQEFMPTPLTDDQIVQLISGAISESGASSIQHMGKVMAILKPKVQGQADMGKVSSLVKQQLS